MRELHQQTAFCTHLLVGAEPEVGTCALTKNRTGALDNAQPTEPHVPEQLILFYTADWGSHVTKQ